MAIIVEEGGYVVLWVILIVALVALLLVLAPFLLKPNLYQSFLNLLTG